MTYNKCIKLYILYIHHLSCPTTFQKLRPRLVRSFHVMCLPIERRWCRFSFTWETLIYLFLCGDLLKENINIIWVYLLFGIERVFRPLRLLQMILLECVVEACDLIVNFWVLNKANFRDEYCF